MHAQPAAWLPVQQEVHHHLLGGDCAGWRHWKAFYAHINQDIMEDIMEEMARKYPVDGVPTSLADLGYKYVGLVRPSCVFCVALL